MNRIERLLWEEDNIKDMAKQKSHGSACAKAVFIALLAGVFALLASRPWPPSFPDARVQTSADKWTAAQSAAAPNPPSDPKAPSAGMRGNGVTTR
jgi:hypothetical protein